jgi:HPt (histidine-containing phosphotransfer) domain-containing protein
VEANVVKVDENYKHLVIKYVNNRKADIKRFEEYFENKLFDEIKKLAHQIKGSGSMYGFKDISFIAKNIEIEAIDNNQETVKFFIDEYRNYIENLVVVFE